MFPLAPSQQVTPAIWTHYKPNDSELWRCVSIFNFLIPKLFLNWILTNTLSIQLSSKTQWQNIKSTWENNKNKPRKQAVALFRLNTGHDCLAAHLCLIKVLSYNHCSICKQKNTIMDKVHLLLCPKLDQTSKELSKLYWDARRLME